MLPLPRKPAKASSLRPKRALSGLQDRKAAAVAEAQCHLCRVNGHSVCQCKCPQHDFHVELNVASFVNGGQGTAAVSTIEQQLHLTAVQTELDQLERRGHDATKIAAVRERVQTLLDGVVQHAATAAPSPTQKPGPLDVDGSDTGGGLRKLIVQILDEEERKKQSTKASFAQELDLEAGAFKILVRSSTPNPANPQTMMSSSGSSGSGFLVDFDQLPVLGDYGVIIERAPTPGSRSGKNEYIVTNGHVVRNADSIAVISALFPTVPMEAELVSVCYDLDIAFLRVKDRSNWRADKFKPFRLCADQVRFIQRTEDVVEGQCGFARLQNVYTVGYPLGVPRVQITKGNVSGFQRISDEPVIQITAPINPGSSGGALVNSEGAVLGITSSGIPSAELTGFAIPIQYIFNLKEVVGAEDKYTKVLEIPYFGAELVGADTYARFLPGFDSRRDTLIVETEETPAAAEGGRLATTLQRVVRKRFTVQDSQRTGVMIVKLDPISILTRPLSTTVDGQLQQQTTMPRPFDMITEFAGFELDNDGLTRGDTYPRKMSLRDLFRTLPFNKRFRVTFYRGTQAFTNDYMFQPKPRDAVAKKQEYPIREISKENGGNGNDTAASFRLPGQLTVTQLTIDFIEAAQKQLPYLTYYSLAENRTVPRLVVLNDESGALHTGDILERVDGNPVRSVRDLQAAVDAKSGEYLLAEAVSGRSTLLFNMRMMLQ